MREPSVLSRQLRRKYGATIELPMARVGTRTGSHIGLIVLALFLLGTVFLWRISEDREFISQFIGSKSFVGMTITIHNTRIVVDLADTPSKRIQGLSGRETLSYGAGLLMKFDEDGYPGIWMKDMNFPIDIVWIDKDWIVRDVTPSVGPETYPQAFYPKEPIRYILEVPAGFADIHNIQIGNTVEH